MHEAFLFAKYVHALLFPPHIKGLKVFTCKREMLSTFLPKHIKILRFHNQNVPLATASNVILRWSILQFQPRCCWNKPWWSLYNHIHHSSSTTLPNCHLTLTLMIKHLNDLRLLGFGNYVLLGCEVAMPLFVTSKWHNVHMDCASTIHVLDFGSWRTNFGSTKFGSWMTCWHKTFNKCGTDYVKPLLTWHLQLCSCGKHELQTSWMSSNCDKSKDGEDWLTM